jgi:hypothetical protein
LLTEKKKRNSIYKNYINLLPTEFNDSPHFFKEEDMEILNHTLAYDQIKADSLENRENINYLKEKVDFEINEEELKILIFVILARIFVEGVNKTYTLSPLADLQNSQSAEKYNIDRYFSQETGDHIMFAHKDIKKGEEIYLSYANPWSNADYLVTWGMTLDDESQNYIAFPELKINFNNVQCSIILNFPANISITERNLFNSCLNKNDSKNTKRELLETIKEELEKRYQSFPTSIEVNNFIYFRKMNYY